MIYDQDLMYAAAFRFAARCVSEDRIPGAVAWLMSRVEHGDRRLARQLMERALEPLAGQSTPPDQAARCLANRLDGFPPFRKARLSSPF